MKTTELEKLIGKEGSLETLSEKLKVVVEIKDARFAFGRTDVLVAPVAGRGSAWVDASRVKLHS